MVRSTLTLVVRTILVMLLVLMFKLLIIAAYVWIAVVIGGGIFLLIAMIRYTFHPHTTSADSARGSNGNSKR